MYRITRIRILAGITSGLLMAAVTLFAHDPHDPFVLVAISPNYSADQTMLAATAGLSLKLGVTPILESTNGGVNWSVLPGVPANSSVSALAFSPGYSQDQSIFVASGSGLFTTNNGGSSWSTLSNANIVSLAISPGFASDNTIVAVTSTNAILISTNRGQTFNALVTPGPLTSGLSTIAVSPNFTNDRTLLVGATADGIFKSTDGGNTWGSVGPGAPLPAVTALTFSPSFASDRTVFAATLGAGFLISTNAGSTWARSNAGLSDLNVSAIALSPTYATDGTMWVTTGTNGVFQSTTRGASWGLGATVSRALSSLASVHYQAIAAGPGVQLMAMFEGLWMSTSSGASWQYVDTLPTRLVRYIHVSPNYAVDQTIFASTYGSGNLWSYNGGISWMLQNTGMQASYTDGSGISPNFGVDGIAFSGNHVGLQRTSDRGATWQMMAGAGGDAYPRGFAVSPNFALDSTVYIGTESPFSRSGKHDATHDSGVAAGLYISIDGGQNWVLSSLSGVGIPSIAFSPAFASDQTAFAASMSGGIYKTTNGGLTWTLSTLPGNPNGATTLVTVSPSFAVDGVVFAGGLNGTLYRSTDRGVTWSVVPNTATIRIVDIKFSPNFLVDQTIFAGTVQFGVMISTNGGATFSALNTFPDVFVTALGISPNFVNDHTLFAAGYHGLYRTTDGGMTWMYLAAPARIEETRNVNSALQEPPSITYQGIWSFVTSSSASSNAYGYTPEPQDTAVLNFVGTGVRWVSWTGPLQGSAALQMDGAPLGTISLTTSVDLFQQTVWEQHGLTCGSHSFSITAAPQASQGLSLDALDIWMDGCPFTVVNAQASLATNSITVGSNAGSGSVLLITAQPWTATSNAPWLTLLPASTSGAGSALIQFSYPANPNQFPITGTLTIGGLTFTVTQAGTSYSAVAALAELANATLNNPQAVALDPPGDVYIADTGNNVIKEVMAGTQELVTLPVTGLNAPAGLAVDSLDNVYIADTGNNAIKQWNPVTGQVTTLITNLNQPTGLARDSQGNLYFANTGANAIMEWTAANQQLTTLVSGLNGPTGVAVDAEGDVYFADTGNNQIKQWSPVSLQVTILASNLSAPRGVGVDAYENLYFSDSTSNAIRQRMACSGLITTLVSSGLNNPAGLAIDGLGNVYVADAGNNSVRKLTLAYLSFSTTSVNEAAGSGSDTVTVLVLPAATPLMATSDQSWLTITSSAGGHINFTFGANLSIAARSAHIDVLGQTVTVNQSGVTAGLSKSAGDGQSASLGQPFFNSLQTLVSDSNGNPLAGIPVTFTVIPGTNGAGGSFNPPSMPVYTGSNGIATAPALVANSTAGQFTVMAAAGSSSVIFTLLNTSSYLASTTIAVGSGAGSGQILLSASGPWTASSNAPWLSIRTGSSSGAGNAWIQFSYTANASTNAQTGLLTINGLTCVVTQAGSAFLAGQLVTTLVSAGLSGPQGAAVDAQSNVYIADSKHNAVDVWNFVTHQVSGVVTSGLNAPEAVALDTQGNVYIADQNNNAIEEWNASANTFTKLVSTGIVHPYAVAVDSRGTVYFSDSGHNSIKQWSPVTQSVTTLVSTGLNHPWGVAVDGSGNVYFADSSNNALKQWTPSGQVYTLVSSGLKGPRGVAVYGGNVFIADSGHGAVDVWNPVTQQLTPLSIAGLKTPAGVAVDSQGNLYIADASTNLITEVAFPYVAFGATSRSEGASAGTDSVSVQVLPAGTPLVPTSDRSWLTIVGVSGGVINLTFSGNTSVSSRAAHIQLLGQQVTITQAGDVAFSIAKAIGNGQSAHVGQAFALALQAKVKDAGGAGVVGAPVTFKVMPGAGGASGSFNPAPPMPILTISGGIATAPVLTAGATAGTFTVIVSTGSLNATYTLTVTP